MMYPVLSCFTDTPGPKIDLRREKELAANEWDAFEGISRKIAVAARTTDTC